MASRLLLIAFLPLFLVFSVEPSGAVVLITASEESGNVVFAANGVLDLDGLAFHSNIEQAGAFICPDGCGLAGDVGLVEVGSSTTQAVDTYTGLVSATPASFGSGSSQHATSGSGDYVGFTANVDTTYLVVPTDYVSGDSIASLATYAGATFASLGMTPGVYTYLLPNDRVTLVVGNASVVPLPATLPLLATSLGGLAAMGWRRKRKAAA